MEAREATPTERVCELRLPGGLTAPARARDAVETRCAEHVRMTRVQELLLLTSELVTNAVRHAGVGEGGELWLTILRGEETIRVTVADPGADATPTVREPDPARAGGIGLFIVEQLSERWGVERRDDSGTEVWFEVRRLDLEPGSAYGGSGDSNRKAR